MTELADVTEKLLKWLDDIQQLGILLVGSAYIRKGEEVYEKLTKEQKEKINKNSFLTGYVLASFRTDFRTDHPDKMEEKKEVK